MNATCANISSAGNPGMFQNLPTEAEFDAMLLRMGFRPCTPEESRSTREAIARTDAHIARQAAEAGMTVEEFHRSFLPQ
jgi:hypothetical protein